MNFVSTFPLAPTPLGKADALLLSVCYWKWTARTTAHDRGINAAIKQGIIQLQAEGLSVPANGGLPT